MSWFKGGLEGRRAVDAFPHPHPVPSWRLSSRRWQAVWMWIQTATPTEEISDVIQRMTTHLAIVTSVILVLLLVHLHVFSISWPSSPVTQPAASSLGDVPIDAIAPDEEIVPLYSFVSYEESDNALERRLVSHTLNADVLLPKKERTWIVTYVVQPGDSIWKIAKKFGLKPETVEWANDLELNPDLLRVGQKLIIPPVDGVVHIVEAGDTLSAIARKYKVKPEDIVAYEPNGLKSVNDPLPENKVIIVPNGIKPFVRPVVQAYSGPIPKGASHGTGNFGWPATGRLTSLFGQIVCSPLLGCVPHKGIDIANVPGTPVVAADSGYVVFAGADYRSGYGKMVIINHGNGFVTLYAHLQTVLVRKGQSVAKGQRIGSIGKTGNALGYHLHFEIRQHGRQRNPLGFLPPP